MRRRDLCLAVLPLAALGLAACFNPRLEEGFTCGEDPPGPQCPDGFYCDAATYTCLLDSTPPTPAAVDLGMMQRGPLAARLGDNVVIAGWGIDSGSSDFTFRVRTHDKLGKPVGQVQGVPEFEGVLRDTVRIAGSDGAVVVGGMDASGVVHLVWVTGAGAAHESTTETYEALTVTGSDQLACFAAGRTPTVVTAMSLIDVGCSNGTPTSRLQYAAANRRGFLSLAAGVADVHDELAVVAEVPPQLPGGAHDLFAFCPSQVPPGQPFAQNLPRGDSLAPQVFYSPGDSLLQVTWASDTRLKTSKLLWPSCLSPGPEKPIGATPATAFAAAGRGRVTGWTSGTGIWAVALHDVSPPEPSIADLLTAADHPLVVEHTRLANAQALTAKDNTPWFFLHASDGVPSQGYFKYTSIDSLGEEMQYLETALVTSDFAVARRNAGSFFLVYREDLEQRGEDKPLPAFLALFDAVGDLQPPAEP